MQLSTLFIIFSLTFTLAAAQTCGWTAPGGDRYDFSGLYKEGGWKADDISIDQDSLFGIEVVYNFCKEMNPKCESDSVNDHAGVYEALEVLGQETSTCEVIGRYDSQTVSLVRTGDYAGQAVNITYGGGERCFNSENSDEDSKPRKASFIVVCAPKTDNEWKQSPVNSVTVTKCSKEFVIHSPAGCVDGVYSSASSIKSLLVWVLIIFVIYLIAGAMYNQITQGKKGSESIPHVDFWRGVPGKMQGGARYTSDQIRLIKGRFSSTGETSTGKTSGGYLNL